MSLRHTAARSRVGSLLQPDQLRGVQPGAGKRLFSSADKDAQKLTLVEHEVYRNGLQKQIFDVVR